MLEFPVEREYGYRHSRKQKRKQRIEWHYWWKNIHLLPLPTAVSTQRPVFHSNHRFEQMH